MTLPITLEDEPLEAGELDIETRFAGAADQRQAAEPVAWLRHDGMKAMPADEKAAWIESGNGQVCEDYTIPLYTHPAPDARPTPPAADAAPAASEPAGAVRVLRDALAWAVQEIERNTCRHEDTYRGGAIWTICRDCGQKWADDRGGFKPYADSPELIAARAALSATAGAATTQHQAGAGQAMMEPIWFIRMKETTGEWGAWRQVSFSIVRDMRKHATLPIYEARQFAAIATSGDAQSAPGVETGHGGTSNG